MISDKSKRFSLRRLLWVGPLGIVLAIVANVVVYFIASALGMIPADILIPQTNSPLTLTDVTGLTAMGMLGGWIVFVILSRFIKNPNRVFVIAALVVLLLSFALPYAVPGMPIRMAIALDLMHVVAAAISIATLTRLART